MFQSSVASGADSLELKSEGWCREQARSAFAKVVPAIRKPNLPDANGMMSRVLREIADQGLVERILTLAMGGKWEDLCCPGLCCTALNVSDLQRFVLQFPDFRWPVSLVDMSGGQGVAGSNPVSPTVKRAR
ncbi:hypothetical protein [Saccharopolyspora sp. NPDC050642]|uniref:hypothetical protein n=1 Tax=Saccharopolyspora sp. NPDC050642 TaxID=3157099 RepID=UPI0033D7584C